MQRTQVEKQAFVFLTYNRTSWRESGMQLERSYITLAGSSKAVKRSRRHTFVIFSSLLPCWCRFTRICPLVHEQVHESWTNLIWEMRMWNMVKKIILYTKSNHEAMWEYENVIHAFAKPVVYLKSIIELVHDCWLWFQIRDEEKLVAPY